MAVLAALQIWMRVGPARAHLVTGPLVALLLWGIGAAGGLSRAELGGLSAGLAWAAGAVLTVVAGYAAALAVPFVRARLPASPPRPVFTALVAVPLATVLVEEVAFRGVLFGLVARDHGTGWAVAVTSLLFGLWHVREKPSPAVVGVALFTAAAGVVFALLRVAGGGLIAPFALHWAVNGLGVLAVAWAGSRPPGAAARTGGR